MGSTRLGLTGVVNPQLECGDSLEGLLSSDLSSDGFDIIISNPPWGQRLKDRDVLSHYPIQTNDVLSLRIQNALSQLREGGRLVLAVPTGFLWRGGPEQKIRKMLLEKHRVEAVISLPKGSFLPYASVDSSIFIVHKGGVTTSVRMVDLSSSSAANKGNLHSLFSKEEIVELVRDPDIENSIWESTAWDVDRKSLADFDFDFTPKKRNQHALLSFLSELPKEIELSSIEENCEVFAGRSVPSSGLIDSLKSIAGDLLNLRAMLKTIDEKDPSQHDKREALQKKIRSLTDCDEYRKYLEALERPYIRIRDVQKSRVLRGTSGVSLEAAEQIDPERLLKQGDVLLSKSGTIGKIGVVGSEAIGGVAAGGFFVLRADSSIVDAIFLLAYLSTDAVQSWLEAQRAGTTIKHLSAKALRKISIPLLPLQMQKRIGLEYLSNGVDALKSIDKILTGEKASDLSQWLNAQGAFAFEKETESILQLSELQRFADSFRQLRNNLAHSNADDSPLLAWGMSLYRAIEPFQGIEDLPEGQALFSTPERSESTAEAYKQCR